MARSDAISGLGIDEWGALMGIEPYELNQVSYGFPVGSSNTALAACEHVFYQYSWQQDFLSRSEVGNAIQRSEEAVQEELGFWPSPRYISSEEIKYPRPAERYLFGAGTNKRGQNKSVQLKYGMVQGAGSIVATDLGAQNVAYSSANSVNAANGILDTFTITFATTITDPTQLAVYFTLSDRDNAPFDDTWRLRPVRVSIAGGTATITGHRSLCVKPELQSAYAAVPLDVTVAGNFVAQLEVYSLVLDTSTTTSDPAQGQAEWEGTMSGGILTPCTITPCQVEVWPVCVGDRNWEMGQAAIDYLLGGQNQPSQGREPDRVVVNYVAGMPRQADGRMDRTMADIVARLATSFLPSDKCGCERSQRIIREWRSYPTDGLGTERSLLPEEVSDCPFEPRAGALWAWQRIKRLRIFEGVSIN